MHYYDSYSTGRVACSNNAQIIALDARVIGQNRLRP